MEMIDLSGKKDPDTEMKRFGYGRPCLVLCMIGSEKKKFVFHSIRPNSFGREREDDRVAAVWLDYQTFNTMPHHVPAIDMVALENGGEMRSLGRARELVLVTAFREGIPYADDLMRIRDTGEATPLDLRRCEKLASYLAQVHALRLDEPILWMRRLRDLVGHGEGIMGLTDNYAGGTSGVSEKDLRGIEDAANTWRWRLKGQSKRLCQVHGDFHPFNIIFEKDDMFWVLDRSRGPWGEAADDVGCLALNYLFFSLQRFGKLDGPFKDLHDLFWKSYLSFHPDGGLNMVVQPWMAWRCLVLANPLWYPDISEDVRSTLFKFLNKILKTKKFDYHKVNEYIA
ncbi:MAG: phosphotransferase [Syntrophorhabdus sp.]